MSKYLFTHKSEVQLSLNWFWWTSHGVKTTVWRNHTTSDWSQARYVENRSKFYLQIWVKYSSQCTQSNENNSKTGVLYGQIIHPALSKLGEKCRKHQHFIYLRLWVQYSLACKDFNNTHGYLRELHWVIMCRVMLKFGEKHWIYEQISIY
jgi:hypothetical protein